MSKIELVSFSLQETANKLGVGIEDILSYINMGELKAIHSDVEDEYVISGWDLIDFVERQS